MVMLPSTPLLVDWELEHVATTADQAIAKHEERLRDAGESEKRARPSPERDEAMTFLREFLTGEPRFAKDVNEAARAAGIKGKPLREARERLVVSTVQRSADGKVIEGFMWTLKPGATTASTPDATTQDGDD